MLRRQHVVGRQRVDLECRKRWRLFARTHIGPDHAVDVSARIGAARTLSLKSLSGGSFGMSTQSPVDVELPAVVDAAQPVFFVAAEEQRGAAMGAELVEQPDLAVAVAEGDQVLAQQPNPHGRAVGLRQLLEEQERQPVLAQQIRPSACPARPGTAARSLPCGSMSLSYSEHPPRSSRLGIGVPTPLMLHLQHQ